jgi:murein DD-endopeptidase MepM/ murein hydrolase activator NlpD
MFDDYSMRSPIPAASSFRRLIVSSNKLESKGFREWLFLTGMLFNARQKWWGDHGPRAAPHEGLDIGIYRTESLETCRLPEGALVPAVFSGEVVKLCDDFLGKSIFVKHDTIRSGPSHLFTIYGHTEPRQGIRQAAQIAEGDLIASVAHAANRRRSIPSHLHVSLAWIDDGLSPEVLGWEKIARSEIVLVDPMPVLDLPHSVID